ncbi:DUF3500 domain-containing protein [Mycobacterium sp. Y57]|uniref:DUF3500 domain-containing protein n=1 Tax=Mycolicibacterium xanthum TaxID=2796469 RepID=UPI001C8472A9|nr:DUF3500 domain-containing protein [Mycolicibacterium xanthum]MBX7434593.1 DUF3500 domain-containing protein [Mycolicibacterium xanthum]
MAPHPDDVYPWSTGRSRRSALRDLGALAALAVTGSTLACSRRGQNGEDSAPAPAAGASLFEADVARAARELIDVTPDDQRARLVMAFDSESRTRGQDRSQTEAFCAVLQWCPLGWGITIGAMTTPQRTAAHALLNRAMSPGGYQALLAVLNRNRVIGEMEDVGDGGVIRRILDTDPTASGAQSVFDVAQNPDPSKPWYPVVGGAKEFLGSGMAIDWSWGLPPGLQARYDQFSNYTIGIFGNPGDDAWAIRFEGHHITVNLTFQKNDDGRVDVHSTPMFFGSFPMIIPESPFGTEDKDKQWHWTTGQVLMLGVVHHLREFWRNVPEAARSAAFIGADLMEQAPPLVLDTPASSMIAALSPTVDRQAIAAYPHIEVSAAELGEPALWNLRQAFAFYTGAMNPTIGPDYLARFDNAVDGGAKFTLSWAGEQLDEIGSHHYTYAVVDDLLLEVLQSNQFSVQHDPEVTGNHLHTMLRDLSFDWDDPMRRHHQGDHTTTHQG